MNLISMLLKVGQKFKLLGIILIVPIFVYFICLRWPHLFSPWWLYTGGALLLMTAGVLVYLLIKKRRENKMASGLEAGIAESEAGGGKVDLDGEIQALRENWQASVKRLKQTGGVSLASLPWYMIIGEPASGKSTLLRKSGLDFPVGDAAIAGMHGTRNCDWWFANEAIFLDTAGRFILETQEQEWLAFLELLKKYRTKKPVNGVLVAVAANSLLTKSHEELLGDGKRIRARVDELIEELGINFPVYVLVTKCDLVSGFVEFFGNLDGRFRDQMLGWTNSAEASEKFDGEAFEGRFDEVSDRLFRMRPWLESSAKPKDLMKAFLYPEEFSYLGEPLRDVLEVVFRQNVYQETPVCRGVYFSSGTQVGSPLARALEDMAKDLNIPADFGLGLTMEEEKELRTYFIKDLVSEQILKDKEMTWRTARADARARKRRMGWGMIGIAAAVILGLFSTFSFLKNQGRLSEFKTEIKQGARPVLVADGCLVTAKGAEMPGLGDVGLNFTDRVVPRVQEEFRAVTLRGCLTPLVQEIAKPLEKGPEKIKRDDGTEVLDIDGWLTHWGHYRYLRKALDQDIEYIAWEADEEAPRVPVKEEAHVDRLHAILVSRGSIDDDPLAEGRATKAQLRRVLVEYGRMDDSVKFPERGRDTYTQEDRLLRERLESLDGMFDRHAGEFITEVQEYVDANLDEKERLKGNTEQALTELKRACVNYRGEIAPHDSPKGLREVARKIAATGNELNYGAKGERNLTDLAAGIERPSDLADILTRLRGEVSQEGLLPDRIDKLLPKLGTSSTDATGGRRAALEGVVLVVDGFLDDKGPPLPFREAVSRDVLKERQGEIAREIGQVGFDAEEKIRKPVEDLEGKTIVEQDADGKDVMEKGRPVLREGWWTTLVLLSKALRADQRKEEYLQDGLRDYLTDDEEWTKEDSREDEEDTYSVKGLNEVVLPFLRDQIDFYGDDLTAKSLRKDTTERSLEGLDGYLDEMEEYWRKRFEDNVPKAATSVDDAVDKFKAWESRKEDFRDTCDEIDKALYDVTKAGWNKADRDHPLLRESAERRDEIFETFAFCFERDDERVDRITTVADAADEFDKLRSSLKKVRRSDDAPEILEELIDPDSSYVACLEAADGLTESRSELSRELGESAREGLEAAGRDLVMQAAAAINREWDARSGRWANRFRGVADFETVFGESGDFERFRKEVLSPFFTLREGGRLEPIQFPDGMPPLRADVAFDEFVDEKMTIEREIIRPGGVGFLVEEYELDLKLEGKGKGLIVEFSPNQGADQVSREYRNGPAVVFPLKWTPSNCRSLVFKVTYEGGVDDKTFRWAGDWAVAEAFANADEIVGGDTYVWRTKKEGVGDYGVRLTLRGKSRLVTLFRQYGGSPLKQFARKVPNVAVSVR